MKRYRSTFLLGLTICLASTLSVPLEADPLGPQVDYKYGSDALAGGSFNQPGYTQTDHYFFDLSQHGFLPDAVGNTREVSIASCFLQDGFGETCHAGELIQTARGVAVDFDYDYAVFDNGQYWGPTHIETSQFMQVDFFAGASLGSYGTYTDGSGGYLAVTATPEPAAWGITGLGMLALVMALRLKRKLPI